MTAFDDGERLIWSGQADAYAATFARLCAYPVPRLLDAAGVGPQVRILDAGTGPGTAAAAACARGALVTAVDAEPGMVSLARRSVAGARFAVAALPELPFPDGRFDAAVANFVLNHVGRPLAALAELRRVVRPGGRIALTVWPAAAADGQALLGRAIRAAGAVRPRHLPALSPEHDFRWDEDGLAELLEAAGLRRTACETLSWNHRAGAEEWWGGAEAGVGFTGRLLQSQPPGIRAESRRRFLAFSAQFAGPDGLLTLPHAALLARGRR